MDNWEEYDERRLKRSWAAKGAAIVFTIVVLILIGFFILLISTAHAGSETWGQQGSTEPRDPKGPTHLWPIWKR